MSGTVTDKLITHPQINYIRVLADDRIWVELPDGRMIRVIKLAQRTASVPAHQLNDDPMWQQLIQVDRKLASNTIDALGKAPKKPVNIKATTAKLVVDVTKTEFVELINTLPPSKYAVKNVDTGEWLFLEIRQNKLGKRWLYKLTGAPGGWNKKYLGYDSHALAMLKCIAANPWQAAQDYTAEHKECAACGAKLSHGKSIEQGFGPICIKKFKPFM